MGTVPMVRGIESAVLFAEVDYGLVNAGVTAVRYDGEGILQLALGVPHLAGGADHRGHGSVHDDVARNVEVGDPFVGVHHRERPGHWHRRPGCRPRSRLFFSAGRLWSLCGEIAEAIVEIHAEFLEDGCCAWR